MNDTYNSVSVLGYKVFSDNLSKIPIRAEKCRAINCSISPNNYGLALKDAEFKNVLKNTEYLVLDGVYFALAGIFLKGKNIKKNQGPEVFKHFMKRLNGTSGKIFFLGSSEKVLQNIKDRAQQEYPDLTVATYSPPFKQEFSKEDNDAMVNAISDFNPDVVFIGMTAPKQEKWSFQHKGRLKAGLIVSIGNVFDWYAGTQKEIHPFYFKIRMAWLVRIFLRPEIFKRNIGNQMTFFRHLLLIVLKLKKQPA